MVSYLLFYWTGLLHDTTPKPDENLHWPDFCPSCSLPIQLKVLPFLLLNLMVISWKSGIKSNYVGIFPYHCIFFKVCHIPIRLQRLVFLFLLLRSRDYDEDLSELGQSKTFSPWDQLVLNTVNFATSQQATSSYSSAGQEWEM